MQRTSILFIGHDLKFLTHVIRHYENKPDCRVTVKTYPGHALQDSETIKRELPLYDLIFCEWGLGNLQWFSQNKIPGQKLITRIHLQELSTNFLYETNWDNVDQVIVVGPLMKEKLEAMCPECKDKCVVIPNLIDTRSFDRPKTEDARFNLGLLGILPKRKAPHLAVELLRELRRTDKRFRLSIKSKRPEELPWLWKKQDEQDYYKKFYADLESDDLRDAVILEPHGSDVQEWFTRIGFIISPSEFESFHMAIAEGMASASIPVIRNWEGASQLFPAELIFKDLQEAAGLIISNTDTKAFSHLGNRLIDYCRKNFSLEAILPQYDEIMTISPDEEKINEEYFKLLVLRKQLASELLSQDQELEKAREVLESYQAIENKYESLESKLVDLESRYESLISAYKTIVSKNESLGSSYKSLESNYKSLESSHLALESKHNGLELKHHELESRHKSLEGQKDKLTRDLEQAKNEREKIKTDLVLQQEKSNNFKHRLDEMNRLYNEANQKLAAIHNSMSWKVGSALVAKPAALVKKIIGK
jgi:glycosyltransferase involved in cell wall biosynthesis